VVRKSNAADQRDSKAMRTAARKIGFDSKDVLPARKTYPDRESVKRDVK
jgi:hypothetical protein